MNSITFLYIADKLKNVRFWNGDDIRKSKPAPLTETEIVHKHAKADWDAGGNWDCPCHICSKHRNPASRQEVRTPARSGPGTGGVLVDLGGLILMAVMSVVVYVGVPLAVLYGIVYAIHWAWRNS
jgi:hypothetical protein